MNIYKSSIPALLVLGMALSACSSLQPVQTLHSDLAQNQDPSVPNNEIQSVASGNNALSIDLLHRLSPESGNLFFSPFSISTALAMTWAGARGQTESQMAQTLHFDLPQSTLHPAFNALKLRLESRAQVEGLDPVKAFTLHIANALWGQQGFPFRSDFLDVLAVNYGSGMNLVNFEKDPEAARQAINNWVSRETEKRIQDIVPQGAIDTLTRLVLANAIYFKADWASEFNQDDTHPRDFHLADGSTVSVPTMNQDAHFRYAQAGNLQAVELPYAGGQVSMVILLPDEGRFDQVQFGLDAASLDALLGSLEYREIDLYLPKFSYEYSLNLVQPLKELGMVDAFDPTLADFSGMDGVRDLVVSDILHKAFVAVDEAGTEAAAATVVIVGLTAAPLEPALELRIDRPFLFLIRDIPTGTILFLGRVMDPR